MSDKWSDDGMIFYCDGKGYALDKEGNTVCVGDEMDVDMVLTDEKKISSMKNVKQKEAMEIIIKNREVSGYGKQDKSFKPRSYLGSRPVGVIKHKQSNVKRIETKKRISLGKSKPT